jgi:hypothetical protein
MSASSTNYRETVFAHHDLTQIQGEPTFSDLKLLTREIKANAMAVHSTLGGGAHGHLGLVLTPAQYATLSPTPFVRPVFPASLVVPAGTTAVASANMERLYKEQLRQFREVMGVENALKQQLTKAVDSDFLDAIRDPVTFVLQGTIAENLTFLVTTYGKVTPETLNEEFEKVSSTIYDPSLPIDTLFNSIVALAELAEAANVPYSEQQQITIAYNILNRSGRFVSDIKEWKRRPAVERTWINLKLHFRRAHDELRETSSETLQAMQQANIAQQVIEGISHLIPPVLPPVLPPVTQPPAAAPVPETPSITGTTASPLTNPTAFYTADQNTIIPSLIQQMGTMQTMMMNMQTSMCGEVGTGGRGLRRRCGRGRGGGRGTGYLPLTHYCWTHGWCRHNGVDCSSPAEGHQPNATRDNRMGGSNRNLTPAPPSN